VNDGGGTSVDEHDLLDIIIRAKAGESPRATARRACEVLRRNDFMTG